MNVTDKHGVSIKAGDMLHFGSPTYTEGIMVVKEMDGQLFAEDPSPVNPNAIFGIPLSGKVDAEIVNKGIDK